MSLELLFSKRISSLFALVLIFIIAFVLGAIIIYQADNLAKLREPVPLYIYE